MIVVTERAASELETLLLNSNVPMGEAIKLVPSANGGISMVIAPAVEGDETVYRGDTLLLIVDSSIAPDLDGVVLDIQPTDPTNPMRRPAQFTLRPPGVES